MKGVAGFIYQLGEVKKSMEKIKKRIFLTPDGKQVVPMQDEKGYLTHIVINKNKYLELVKNGTIDRESILDVDAIVLLTMSGKRTEILLENGRQFLTGDRMVDDVFQTGKFIFHVKKDFKVHSASLRFNVKTPGRIKQEK